MAGLEVILGAAMIIAALVLGWAARPSATGPVRRFAMTPVVEEYFIIGLMVIILAGACLIILAMRGA
jgi:hypothetical protein